MDCSNKYRVRFRFRLQKKLNISDKSYQFNVRNRDVRLTPQLPDMDISDSEWLVMNTTGFESQKEAEAFARKLKSACEVSSVAARLGIDSGTDLPTSGFGQLVKDQLRESGLLLRDNIHGLDVFVDDPSVRIAHISGTGTVMASPDRFLGDLDDLFESVERVSPRIKDIILLLNYALLRPEPVAKIVFAFSAVEMLGQDEDWSSDQRRLLRNLAVSVLEAEIGSVIERQEVAIAIEKTMYRLSLRQGVMRLLTSLQLQHLKPAWDSLYRERSSLIHGLAPKPGIDYSQLAYRAVSLCGQILLTAIAKEVPGVNKHVHMLYEPAIPN